MGYKKRDCDNCKKEYQADTRNLRRGWGLCCSKSCAAKKREKSKKGYNPERVARNNIKRADYGKEVFAKKRGFRSYEEYEETHLNDDGTWDSGGMVELSICEFCDLRVDVCHCD